MKIESVLVRTVVVVNGESHTIRASDWTDYMQKVKGDSAEFKSADEVVEFVRSEM